MAVTLREQPGHAPTLHSDLLGAPHGFSTRLGGVSDGIFTSMNLGHSRGDNPLHVEENFRRFCTATGCGFDSMVFTRQVHGDTVRQVTAADANQPLKNGVSIDCDGLMTNAAHVSLVIFSADCIPVLLHDPVRKAIAAVHAGWRGTALAIPAVAVARMRAAYGTNPADIRAVIGPGISRCCFETDGDVPAAMPAWAADYITARPHGKFMVDLKTINARALQNAGVPASQIDISDACTMCQSDVFWSHRKTKGERGSLAAIIELP